MSSRQTTTSTGTQAQSGTQSGTQSGSESGAFTGDSTNQNQFANQSQFGWQHTPDTQDITALRGFSERLDPSIGAAHSRRTTNLRNSFINPLGANTTSAIRDATQRSLEGEMEQDYGQAQRQGYNDMQQRTGARLAGLASLTAPTLTQTGSSGTSTDTGSTSGTSTSNSTGSSSGNYSGTGSNTGSSSQSTPLLPSILGGAMGVGAAALTLLLAILPQAWGHGQEVLKVVLN